MCRHREKKAAKRPAHCVRTNRLCFDDEDFAAAISGILPSSNSCAEKETVAMKWENKSGRRPTDDSQLLRRAPFPCETPCSRQMRRYLRGAHAWNSEPNLRSLLFQDCGKPTAITRHDASVALDSSAVEEMLAQEDARIMPGNVFIPKAVHCSHMRLPRHISKLLHASLIADLNDRHDFQVGKIGTAHLP